MLERFGYDTPAAFIKGMGDPINELVARIENDVRLIDQSDQIWDSTRKKTVVDALKILGKTPSTFFMPFGHKLLLRAIREHCQFLHGLKLSQINK